VNDAPAQFAIECGRVVAFSRTPRREEQQRYPRVTTGGRIMAAKITSEVLESYLHCKYKGEV
jgi:hypothetical protein